MGNEAAHGAYYDDCVKHAGETRIFRLCFNGEIHSIAVINLKKKDNVRELGTKFVSNQAPRQPSRHTTNDFLSLFLNYHLATASSKEGRGL
jgi:hypothetical protein